MTKALLIIIIFCLSVVASFAQGNAISARRDAHASPAASTDTTRVGKAPAISNKKNAKAPAAADNAAAPASQAPAQSQRKKAGQ